MPDKIQFNFRCPQCTALIHRILSKREDGIFAEAVECECGWSEGEQGVENIECLEDD